METVPYNMDNKNEQYGMGNAYEQYGMDNTNEHYGMDSANETYGMDNMEAKIPGPFIEQQAFQGNPTKEERKTTDTPYITIYSIILFIWLYTIITVINYDEIPIEKLNVTREVDLFTIDQMHPRFTWKFPLCTIISGLIAIVYIYILSQSMGIYIVYSGMFFLCCLTLLTIIAAFFIASLLIYGGIFAYMLIFFLFAFVVSIVVFFIISLRCARNVGTAEIFEVIRESCRALSCCPSIAIFTCIISVIIILILTFMVYITKIIILANCSDSIFRFYVIINLFCALALTNFFTNLTQIVISGYVVDWIWAKDPNLDVSIRRSVEKTWNFHIGTVAFFSIPLLPHIWFIYQLWKYRGSDIEIKQYDIPTRFCSQLRVFISIVDFALIQTAIYGYECERAIRAARDLVSQNNHEINLAVCEISNMVIWFGSYLVALPFHVEHLNSSIYSLVIPFYLVMATAIRTLLVNKMINNCTSEDLKDQCDNVPQYGTIITD